MQPPLYLASSSPRRKQLLSLGGWSFETVAADIDESPLAGEEPVEHVVRLACLKAETAAQNARPGSVVIAADTIVVDGGEILGKPADLSAAESTLRRLRGHVHKVYTAIAVYHTVTRQLLSEVCVSEVPMRLYSDDEMRAYIASGDPLDKAGSYAIQHRQFRPVTHLADCYANVVGLPLCHLTRVLARLGIYPPVDVPEACQKELEYDCPVYEDVLQGVL